MVTKLYDRVKVAAAAAPSTGVFAIGAAVPGFRTFIDAGVSVGALVPYCIEDGQTFEIGHGTFDGAGHFTRIPEASSNGTSGGPPRYYELTLSQKVYGNGSNGYKGAKGITLAAAPGGNMPAYTFVAGHDEGSYAIANLFDNDPTTKYEGSHPENDVVLVLDFGAPISFAEIRNAPIDGYSNEAWNTIKIRISSDGQNWFDYATAHYTFPDNYSTSAEQTYALPAITPGGVQPLNASSAATLMLTALAADLASTGGGSGGGTTPTVYPKIADFAGYDGDPGITTGTGGQFVATDDTDGLTLVMSGQANGDRWKGLYKVIPTPAAKWSLRVRALLDYDSNGYACAPLIIYRDGGTAATVLGKNVAGATAAVQMQRAGVGYNGNPYESQALQQWEWFRVDFDGTDTLTWYASKAGKAWAQLFTQSASGGYGGLVDRFAVGIECNKPGDASGVSLKSLSFVQG
jgi:hypothetical protein